MNILDIICIAIIAACMMICLIKGFKKVIFKLSSFVIAMILAKLFGNRIGKALLSKIIDIDIGAFSDKLNSAIISALGTLIVFVMLFVLLRLIFKVVEGKMERSIRSVVVDRLWGALTGFIIGVAFVFVFTETVYIILTTVSAIKCSTEAVEYIDKTIIFKFFRNLN